MTEARFDGTVLVVEDDSAIRQTVVEILEFEGYQVVQARDGTEALELITRQKPSLVLLDLTLPILSGHELMAELERAHLRAGMPIIVLTADSRARQKAQDLHADGFLEKPFSLAALLDTIERLIGVENSR